MRVKRSIYEKAHKEYVRRVIRRRWETAFAISRLKWVDGKVGKEVLQHIGDTYSLHDPILPDLYRVLDMHNLMKGTLPDVNDVKMYYYRIEKDTLAGTGFTVQDDEESYVQVVEG